MKPKKFKHKLVMIFDNAAIHKQDEHRKFLRSKGYMAISTPRYSPDLNPVERFFREVKQSLVKLYLNTDEHLYKLVARVILQTTQSRMLEMSNSIMERKFKYVPVRDALKPTEWYKPKMETEKEKFR